MAWSAREWLASSWFGPWFVTGEASPNTVARPGTGTLVVSGHAPTVTASDVIPLPVSFPARIWQRVRQVFRRGLDPVTVAPAVGSIMAMGLPPRVRVSQPMVVGLGMASVRITGHAPDVSATTRRVPRRVVPRLGARRIVGHAPTVDTPQRIAPASAVCVATGYAPTVSVPVVARMRPGSATATGHAPVVVVTDDDPRLPFSLTAWEQDDDDVEALLFMLAAL